MQVNNSPIEDGHDWKKDQKVAERLEDERQITEDLKKEDASVPCKEESAGEEKISVSERMLEEKPWSSFASFRLAFQSRSSEEQCEQQVVVRHIDGNEEKIWSTPTDENIYAWILERANVVRDERPAAIETMSMEPAVEITQIKFLQPSVAAAGMMVDQTHSLPSGLLQSREPVALEVSFTLFGMDNTESSQTSYQIQGKFHNRATRDNIPFRLRQAEHLVAGQRSYMVRLPEVVLSPGPYEMDIVTTLQNSEIHPAMLHVPVLQVI